MTFELRRTSKDTMATSTKIPIIDISPTGDEEQEKVARELVEAAIEHGFVYIRNRGADIPAAAVDEAFDLVRELASFVKVEFEEE